MVDIFFQDSKIAPTFIQKKENGKWVNVDPLEITAKLIPGDILELHHVRVGSQAKKPSSEGDLYQSNGSVTVTELKFTIS